MYAGQVKLFHVPFGSILVSGKRQPLWPPTQHIYLTEVNASKLQKQEAKRHLPADPGLGQGTTPLSETTKQPSVTSGGCGTPKEARRDKEDRGVANSLTLAVT